MGSNGAAGASAIVLVFIVSAVAGALASEYMISAETIARIAAALQQADKEEAAPAGGVPPLPDAADIKSLARKMEEAIELFSKKVLPPAAPPPPPPPHHAAQQTIGRFMEFQTPKYVQTYLAAQSPPPQAPPPAQHPLYQQAFQRPAQSGAPSEWVRQMNEIGASFAPKQQSLRSAPIFIDGGGGFMYV
jgi:hypothetical protein